MEGKTIKDILYVIKKRGEGHAGTVYKARLLKDTKYGKVNDEFGIKVYNDWVLSQANQASRIDSELQMSLRIKSENVVKSYELVHHENKLILVMEYLNGRTLSQYLEEEKKIPFERIIKFSKQLIQGLEKIHKEGLIHRDLKPDNIMITDDSVVIMDLGVVKDFNASISITGSKFLGTIKYAAPEYLFDEEYDHSIDLFSFGLILFELIFNESLIKTNYWTMNIVEHYFYKYRGPNDYIKVYTEFPSRFQENEITFLWILLNSLLENKENRIRLETVLNALESEIWNSISDWNIYNSQKVRYKNKNLILSNFIAMKDLEMLLGESIPIYNSHEDKGFGFKATNENITLLSLGQKELKKLPDSIGALSKLRSMYLVGNDLTNLPETFSNLVSLKFLNLTMNDIDFFPKNFGNLSKLQDLIIDLPNNMSFPLVITDLPSLKKFTLIGFNLNLEIPKAFIKLLKLEEFELLADYLGLPEEFGMLKALKIIKFHLSELKNIPKSFWELENLIELDFHVKNCTYLPPEIQNLKKLEKLNLNNCPLDALPSEIGFLNNLKILEIDKTNIKDLPREILKLEKLEKIYASYDVVYGSDIAKELKKRGVKIASFKSLLSS